LSGLVLRLRATGTSPEEEAGAFCVIGTHGRERFVKTAGEGMTP